MKLFSRMAVALAVCTPLLGQTPVGSISGIVKDPSGAIIPGAAVSSTSISDGAKRAVTTNDQGYFLIPTLLPGDTKAVSELPGFRNFEVERVSVAVGQNVRIDAPLAISGDIVSVDVAGGDVEPVDPQQSVVGGVVNTRQIDQLPLN